MKPDRVPYGVYYVTLSGETVFLKGDGLEWAICTAPNNEKKIACGAQPKPLFPGERRCAARIGYPPFR